MGEDASISEHQDTSDEDVARLEARSRDAAWVRDARAGDPDAFGRLYDAWFERVFHLVARILHDQEAAAEVTQDAFLSAWRNLAGLQDPEAFGGWLLRIARNAAFNRSGRDRRSTPVDERGLVVIEATGASPGAAPAGFDVGSRLARHQDPEVAVGDHEVVALVRETVGALSDRDGEVLDLQLRSQLSPAEIGEVLGLNRNAANQLCHRVRGRFATAFRARMLWGHRGPTCPALTLALAEAGVASFGAAAVDAVGHHLAVCQTCTEESETRVQPTALFAALPLIAAPAGAKSAIAAELVSHGVPVAGSASFGSGEASSGADGVDAGDGPGGPASAEREVDPTVVEDIGTPTDPSALQVETGPALGPPPPPEPGVPALARRSGAARRTRLLAAAAVVAILAALGGLLAWDGDPSEGELLANEAGSTTTDPDDATSSSTETTSTSEGDPAPDPTAPGPAPGTPGSSPPGQPTTTPTTSDVPQPAAIEVFELLNGDPQPAGYAVGPTSPVLRWQVTGAESVEIWTWYDDGVNGPQQLELLSTEPAGELQLCPGQVVDGQCQADPGTYSYRVIAVDSLGVEAAPPEPHPSFEIYQVIL